MQIALSAYQFRLHAETIVSDGWAIMGIWFLIGLLRTNRIRSREAVLPRIFDIGAIVLGFYVMFARLPWPGLDTIVIPPHFVLIGTGVAAALLGLALTMWARLVLGRYWSAVVAEKEDHRLIQSGPYAVVRHPLYSGILLALLGTAAVFDHWSSLIGIVILYFAYLRRAFKEDKVMSARFGDEFTAYRRGTGLIVPGWG